MKEVEQILFNPEQAMRLKTEQLKNLAEMNGSTYIPTTEQSIYGSGGGGDMSNPDEYQVELRVPNPMVGLIIGKGGENIHKMQLQTGVHVQIAKESDMKPGETLRSIVLKGKPEAVAECKKRVDEIVSNRLQVAASQANNMMQAKTYNKDMDFAFVMKVPVPNDKVGIIIGKGGVTIKGIQERSRATVQIPAAGDEDNPTVRTLSIGADSKEAVDAAQSEIAMALHQHAMQSTGVIGGMPGNTYNIQVPPTTPPLYITVPDDKVGIIIGKGGTTIKDIQTRCRVKIAIPPTADPGSNPPIRTCSIVGTAESQHQARYEIELVLQNHANGLPTGPLMNNQYNQQQQYGQQQPAYGAASMYAAAPAATWGAQGAYYGQQAMGQYAQPYAQPYGMAQQYPTGAMYDPNANPYAAMAAAGTFLFGMLSINTVTNKLLLILLECF